MLYSKKKLVTNYSMNTRNEFPQKNYNIKLSFLLPSAKELMIEITHKIIIKK